MKKKSTLNKWLWKWHFIAGLISLPFVLILSVTGAIYLFKTDYETPIQKHIKEVTVQGTPLSFQEQWGIANKHAIRKPNSISIPTAPNQATEFISGRFGGKSSLYINPYNGKVSGEIIGKKTDMYLVRKLHGELLMGSFGTKIIELIASWMIVLILTGLYVWWPQNKWTLKGYFIPRTNIDRRIFYRDMHAISGFWISVLLLMILAGGFPWTDVFGNNFKQVQKITNTGFPTSWQGRQLSSKPTKDALTLDQMVVKAKKLQLPGQVTLSFPKGSKGVFSVSNFNPSDLSSQQKIHFDQYSGVPLVHLNWQDVGILMRGRMWFMAFHQGEFGVWNWWLMLITAIILAIMSLSAIASYTLRKRRKSWGVPKVPASFKLGYGIIFVLTVLSIIFPLFGGSLLLIIIIEYIRQKFQKRKTLST